MTRRPTPFRITHCLRHATLLMLAFPTVFPCLAQTTSGDANMPSASSATDLADEASPASLEPTPSVPQQKIPPALTHYRGREIATTMHYTGAPWLIREERQREEDCTKMLEQLNVQRGMTVCDMGCGNGFYTLQLAERVGTEGRVLAVDIQPEMLRLLQERAATAGLKNVLPIHGSVIDPGLPKAQVDLILCVDVYHEFSHPEQMLAAMRASLKPDGELVLVEFRGEDPSVPIKPLHKMTKKQVLREMQPNGLQLSRQFDDLPWQHMMFFRKSTETP